MTTYFHVRTGADNFCARKVSPKQYADSLEDAGGQWRWLNDYGLDGIDEMIRSSTVYSSDSRETFSRYLAASAPKFSLAFAQAEEREDRLRAEEEHSQACDQAATEIFATYQARNSLLGKIKRLFGARASFAPSAP